MSDSDLPLPDFAGRLLAWVSAAYVCTRTDVDPDLWGHLKFGLDMLHARTAIPVDHYSFTHDAPWVDHEWLGEIVQAAAFQIAGVPGLMLLKILVLGAAFWVMASIVRRAANPVRWWLLAAGIISLAPIAFHVRPQLWTILGVTLVWRALDDQRYLKWLPLVFAVWANLHGGWVLGFAIGGLWIVGRALDTRSIGAVTRPAGFFAASAAATLINPYGWQLWLLLAETAGTPRNIGEWRRLWEQPDSSLVLWLAIAIGVVATTMIRRRQQVTYAAALPVLWLAVSGVLTVRVAPIFGEVAVMALAPAWRASAPPMPSRTVRPGLVAIVAITLVIVSLANLIPQSRCLPIRDAWTPDLAAAGAFEPDNAKGRLVLQIDWGEYAIWHWSPRLLVSIDGRLGATTRAETVYSEDVIRTQTAVRAGLPEGLAWLARARPEYVWLARPSGAQTQAWLRANGYSIDVETGRSFVARRSDLPPLTPGAPAPGCFP